MFFIYLLVDLSLACLYVCMYLGMALSCLTVFMEHACCTHTYAQTHFHLHICPPTDTHIYASMQVWQRHAMHAYMQEGFT